MRKGFSLIELIVIISIIVILIGMIIPAVSLMKKRNAAPKFDSNHWAVSVDLTESARFRTHIITDPRTDQKWIFVVDSRGVAITPYIVPTKVEAEKTKD